MATSGRQEKRRRERAGAGEAKDDRAEDRRQQAAVHEDVWHLRCEVIAAEPSSREAAEAHDHPAAHAELRLLVNLADGDAAEEGAEVGKRRVLEELDVDAGAVAVGRVREVVGIRPQIDHVRQHAEQPEAEAHHEELADVLRET